MPVSTSRISTPNRFCTHDFSVFLDVLILEDVNVVDSDDVEEENV